MRKATLGISLLAAAVVLALPAGALARAGDRDGDKMPDRWEQKHGLKVKKNDAKKDPDRDRVSNLSEFRAHTNPRDRDTDDDGLRDGDERSTRNDPRDRDTDDDGRRDGDEVNGTIQSFTPGTEPGTGTLTIALAGGGTMTGLVDSTTRIECGGPEDGVRSASSGPGHDGDGGEDNSGPGSSNSGPGSGDADDDDRDDDDCDDDERACTTADLTPGTPVHEAELETRNGQAVFEEVELVE
jgi:hypothetical protein